MRKRLLHLFARLLFLTWLDLKRAPGYFWRDLRTRCRLFAHGEDWCYQALNKVQEARGLTMDLEAVDMHSHGPKVEAIDLHDEAIALLKLAIDYDNPKDLT